MLNLQERWGLKHGPWESKVDGLAGGRLQTGLSAGKRLQVWVRDHDRGTERGSRSQARGEEVRPDPEPVHLGRAGGQPESAGWERWVDWGLRPTPLKDLQTHQHDLTTASPQPWKWVLFAHFTEEKNEVQRRGWPKVTQRVTV